MFAVTTIALGAAAIAFAQAPLPDGESPRPEPPPIVLEPVPRPPPSRDDLVEEDATFERQLASAKASYFSGDIVEAASLLQDLWDRMREGEEPGAELRREALSYLSEIRYRQDALDVAEAVLRWLLEHDPAATMSPFHHPAEVVQFFEKVQAKYEMEQQQRRIDAQRGPPPLWTFLPLGYPQARQGRTGAALAFGGLQIAFGATNLALRQHLKAIDTETVPAGVTVEELEQRVRLLTHGIQWPSAVLFYGTWVLSAGDALRQRRRPDDEPPTTGFTVVPMGPRGTFGLTLVGRLGGPAGRTRRR